MSTTTLRVGADSLADLLAPISVNDFAESIFGHRMAYRPGATGRYDPLLTLDDVEELLLTLTSPTDMAWLQLVRRGNTLPIAGPLLDRQGMLSPPHVFDRFTQGFSIVLNQVQRRSMRLRRFCAGLERDLTAACRVLPLGEYGANVYLSPPGQQAFGAHYDAEDVFVFQLSGRKRWSIWPRLAPAPVSARQRVPVPRDTAGESVVLTSGDLLYLPRGVPHAAATFPDEHSMHLTIGVPTVTEAAVLREMAEQSETLGRALHSGRLTDGEHAGAHLTGAQLASTAQRLRLRGLASSSACDTGVLRQLRRPVAEGAVVRVRPGAGVERASDSEDLTLVVRGAERRFHPPVADAVRLLLAHRSACVGTDLAVNTAATLLAIGVVEFAEPVESP